MEKIFNGKRKVGHQIYLNPVLIIKTLINCLYYVFIPIPQDKKVVSIFWWFFWCLINGVHEMQRLSKERCRVINYRHKRDNELMRDSLEMDRFGGRLLRMIKLLSKVGETKEQLFRISFFYVFFGDENGILQQIVFIIWINGYTKQ